MDEFKKIFLTCITLIILGLIIIPFFIPNSNPFIKFSGKSESYSIEGQNSLIIIKADSVGLLGNITEFRDVMKITVMNWDGEIYSINDSPSHIQVDYKENRNYVIFADVYASIYFDNLTIVKSNSQIDIESKNKERIFLNGKFLIFNDSVDSISINGEKLKDFNNIYVEMDNLSYIDLTHGKIKLNFYDVSKSNIKGKLSKYFSLRGSEGTITIEDYSYDIKNTDTINIIFNSKNLYSCEIQDINTIFYGNANSISLNGNNIIKSKMSYWFDQEPEKINTLVALILALITGLYVYITKGILKQTELSVKQSEASVKQSEKIIEQTEKIIEQTKTEKRFDDNEKLLMHVYSPMEVILTKFELGFEYISQSLEPHEISSEYNSLFQEMNDSLLEIKRNYGYLFDQDLIQLHNEVWKLWKQYLNSDDPENKTTYDTLNSRITGLHDLITDKITNARIKRDKIIENSYS